VPCSAPRASSRIARDLDSTSLLLKLSSRDARPLRRKTVDALAASLAAALRSALARRPALPKPPSTWPDSPVAALIRRRREAHRSRVAGLLLRHHLVAQLRSGWRGLGALGALAAVSVRRHPPNPTPNPTPNPNPNPRRPRRSLGAPPPS
jgi:hypothetical protein